ncbi:hypothetical protein DICPUDRAFT_13362, partial [Dictyostelium purpureum]
SKVPILRFQDKETDVFFDLSLHKSSVGLQNSLLLKEYVDIDERCKQLIILVKWWASQKNLNDASKDSFSSFCLSSMVIHFLQSLSPPVLP